MVSKKIITLRNLLYFGYLRVIVISVTLVSLVGLLITGELFSSSTQASSSYLIASTFMLATLSLVVVIMSTKLTERHPPLFVVSLIGNPHSGKTVYLTVLFNKFLKSKETFDSYSFYPHGSETLEYVNENYHKLIERKWLDPTNPLDTFPFRVVVTSGESLYKRKMEIEINDYAGEHLISLEKAQWLHKSKYFRNIIASDAILFAIDCEDIIKTLISGDKTHCEIIQSNFIMAIDEIMENKGVDRGRRKLETPIAFLFMKSDLLIKYEMGINNIGNDYGVRSNFIGGDDTIAPINYENFQYSTEKYATSLFNGLFNHCHKNCKTFNRFFISSTGLLDINGLPPKNLSPKYIEQPIIWVLNRFI